MTKNRVLGKGLSSLMGMQAQLKENNNSNQQERISLNISEIIRGKFQPRKIFNEENLEELSKSIAQKGVLQPIIVKSKDEDGKYQIIAGERRWRAAQKIGLKQIPAIVKNISDNEAYEYALIENIQRKNLTPIEEAEGYKKLMDEYSYTQDQLSSMISKSRSHITNLLRLLSLSSKIKTMVNEGQLSMGHARALINVETADEIAEKIVKDGISVRKTEKLVKKLAEKTNIPKKVQKFDVTNMDEDLSIIEKSIMENLGMNVKISETETGGKISIDFSNLEQLDLLLQKLTV